MRSNEQPLQRALAEKAMTELAQVVDKLAPGKGPLNQAAENLQSAIMSGHTGVLPPRTNEPGGVDYGPTPVGYNESVAGVIFALQARIQEIMLEVRGGSRRAGASAIPGDGRGLLPSPFPGSAVTNAGIGSGCSPSL